MISAVLYSDDQVLDLTGYIDQAIISRSTSDEGADLRVRLPWGVLTDQDLSLDWWLLIGRKDGGPSLFFGRVSSVSWGVRAATGENAEGVLLEIPITIRAESWLSPLKRSQIFISARSVGVEDHVFKLSAWSSTMRELITAPFGSNDIGEVLDRILAKFLPHYRLPKTILGGADLSRFRVIYSRDTARAHAPEREPYQRSVFGLALNTQSAILPSGSPPYSLISSLFSADPNLVELFPSTEPLDDGSLLKCSPVLIYRTKPFFSGALSSASALSARVAQEEAASIGAGAVVVSLSEIIDLNLSRDESARVNMVYMDTPASVSRGIDAFGLLGSPRIDAEDVEKFGLRAFRGSWPFFPRGDRAEGPLLADQIQAVTDLAASIVGQSHRFMTGTLFCAFRPDITQGSWVRIPAPLGGEGDLLAYAEGVQHMITVDPQSGTISARSRLQFIRAFYEGSDTGAELEIAPETGSGELE